MPKKEREPRVVAADVAAVLRRAGCREDRPDAAERRAAIAENAGYSTETLKRIEDGKVTDLTLDKADRIVTAAGGHLSECRVLD